MDETPLRERLLSKRSPGHIKTLDILAKSAKFSSQSISNLKKYCSLARTEGDATSVSEAGAFLEERYGWEVQTREAEMKEAWAACCSADATPSSPSTTPSATPSSAIPQDSVEKSTIDSSTGAGAGAGAAGPTPVPVVHPGRVYLSLKKDACTKTTLLCQIEDHQRVKFTGDAGAIGRLTVKEGSEKITIDLKGQQFEGELFAGPTVLMVNTSHNPFAAKSSAAAPVQERMKVEAITNEFGHFKFKKDLMSDLIGNYTGDVESMQKPARTSSTGAAGKKRKSSGGDGDDTEDGDDEEGEEGPRRKKAAAGSRNPKITTINRKQGKEKKKRKSTSKK
mmetsp:Transcript_31766/g.59100  ORF Transcript_31766/g.59100 Transcript_31766/m.59100 type:complete len:336 (-) Transcript_31766:93-1100(-)